LDSIQKNPPKRRVFLFLVSTLFLPLYGAEASRKDLFRRIGELCTMPYRDHPDDLVFDPVKEPVWGNNQLAIVNIGKLRQ